eukprot:6191833-Pleurochrysis_carterae.AAC.2
MRFASVVAPVHVVPRAVADGNAGRTCGVTVACESVIMRAGEKVTELVGVEVRTRPCTRARDLGIVQNVAV